VPAFSPDPNAAAIGVHLDVAVVADQRGAFQRLLDVQVNVDRVGVVGDLDVVPDVAQTDHPGHRLLGGGAARSRAYARVRCCGRGTRP
jgi:hypothetical protein